MMLAAWPRSSLPNPCGSPGCSAAARRRPRCWAAAPFGPGSRVVAVRPLSSAWLANHAVDVADAAGATHELVLRRWARPGWDDEDPDFNAAREAAVLELLAPTPVPAPPLVAADPDGVFCDARPAARPPSQRAARPAQPGPGRPGRGAGRGPPARPRRRRPGRDPTRPQLSPLLRARDPGPAGLVDPAPAVGTGLRRGGRPAAGRPGLLHPPRLPPGQHALDRRPAHRGGRLDRRVVGPPSVDLGHMRVNLAADLGPAVADRFLAAHHALTGFDHHPWWDVASAVDVVPETGPAWRGAEDLVAAALAPPRRRRRRSRLEAKRVLPCPGSTRPR